ncbi:MAG: cyclic nucleotide-binding domain-containing protein [Deltaproteobacteria bacterium]|nr:MAG: cyclic nucleotide-binding domain-containing protein [Deltaproteobacteria bacterium]
MQLPSCYLFERLSEPQKDRIAAITLEKEIRKGEWLFQEGQEAKRLFLLRKGTVELVTLVNDSIEIPITIVRSTGGCFGIGALVEPYRYSLSARCTDDSTLLVINQADIKELIRTDSDLGCTIMTNLAQKLLDRLKETRQESKIHINTLIKSAAFS